MAASKYRRSVTPINSNLTVVQNQNYQWGVVDRNGHLVVPFGKYRWIDGFHNGLAKVIGLDDTIAGTWEVVKLTNGDEAEIARQGIINEKGEEVLPLEYNIWKFYGKDYTTIKAFKNGTEYRFAFSQLNPDLAEEGNEDDSDCEEHHYEEFAGSYAQDVAGYSDEEIYDVFEGDPDAYWNID